MSSSGLDHPVGVPEYSPAVSSDDEKEDCMRAKIALEYYNNKNGTTYELVCPLLSNGFQSDGNWVHCNFAAWQRGVVTSSRRLFFAEMHGGDDVSWTVTACIVLEGDLTAGCSLCSEVIHPTHGFRQGHHKPQLLLQPTAYLPTSFQSFHQPSFVPSPEELKPNKYKLPNYSHLTSSPNLLLPNSYSPTSDLLNPYRDAMSHIPIVDSKPPRPFLTAEQVSNLYRERAGIALEYYNKEKGANYEIVDVLVCKSFLSGEWFHCNFTAKPPSGDTSSKLFFGEICLETETATACVILEEDSKTTNGCNLCLEVIHPTDGFVKGRDKNDVRFDDSKFMRVPLSYLNMFRSVSQGL